MNDIKTLVLVDGIFAKYLYANVSFYWNWGTQKPPNSKQNSRCSVPLFKGCPNKYQCANLNNHYVSLVSRYNFKEQALMASILLYGFD